MSDKGKDTSEEDIHRAIKQYFGDTSRSIAETKAGLQAIVEETEILIEALS